MITNKTTFLQFIKQHILEDATMKDLRYARIFSSNKTKHFRVSICRCGTSYTISLMQTPKGSLWCGVDTYRLFDDGDGELINQGTFTCNSDGVIDYDSFHLEFSKQ